jgi:hypothetical protein
MRANRFEQSLPVAGILAGVCFAVFVVCSGVPPSVHAGIAKQVAWWHDHAGQVTVADFASGLFLVTMAFFATGLRQALRSGESGESTYSSVAYAGGLLVGAAVAMSGWISYAAGSAGHDREAATVHTFSYLYNTGWVPWTASSAVMLLGVGIGGLRTAALPKWLAVVSIALGATNVLGPAAIVAYFLTPFWLIATGVVLRHRLTTSATVPSSFDRSHA